ncbi:hypothetical protein SNE40_004418 [Patella caerulea]
METGQTINLIIYCGDESFSGCQKSLDKYAVTSGYNYWINDTSALCEFEVNATLTRTDEITFKNLEYLSLQLKHVDMIVAIAGTEYIQILSIISENYGIPLLGYVTSKATRVSNGKNQNVYKTSLLPP